MPGYLRKICYIPRSVYFKFNASNYVIHTLKWKLKPYFWVCKKKAVKFDKDIASNKLITWTLFLASKSSNKGIILVSLLFLMAVNRKQIFLISNYKNMTIR